MAFVAVHCFTAIVRNQNEIAFRLNHIFIANVLKITSNSMQTYRWQRTEEWCYALGSLSHTQTDQEFVD